MPAKVEGVFWEGYVFPAGIVGPTTVTRTPRAWGWRRPDPSSIVGAAFTGIYQYFVCIIDLSELFPCGGFLFLGNAIRVGLQGPFLVGFSDLIIGGVHLYAEDIV